MEDACEDDFFHPASFRVGGCHSEGKCLAGACMCSDDEECLTPHPATLIPKLEPAQRPEESHEKHLELLAEQQKVLKSCLDMQEMMQQDIMAMDNELKQLKKKVKRFEALFERCRRKTCHNPAKQGHTFCSGCEDEFSAF